jgi:hypothetical protein
MGIRSNRAYFVDRSAISGGCGNLLRYISSVFLQLLGLLSSHSIYQTLENKKKSPQEVPHSGENPDADEVRAGGSERDQPDLVMCRRDSQQSVYQVTISNLSHESEGILESKPREFRFNSTDDRGDSPRKHEKSGINRWFTV